MTIDALGYVGLRTKNLEDWASFGPKFLGLELVDRSRSTLTFRMDDRKQRIVVEQDGGQDGGQAAGFFGWEVADPDALDRLGARLEAARVPVTRAAASLAEERRVREILLFADPAGNRLEAFCGAEVASDPFRPGRSISGFRTGPLGVGHAVLTVERLGDVMPFYQDLLGFRLSDYMLDPVVAYFFHVNPRHHSLALVETGRNGLHHLMVELFSLDDVGQGYDLALGEDRRIATTLGRHSNDLVTSFYATTPSDFLVEYGWGGREIDPATWSAVHLDHGPSLWGHERNWLPAEARARARAMRLRAAAEGQREPVQVMEGNHRLMRGTCPWWDETMRR